MSNITKIQRILKCENSQRQCIIKTDLDIFALLQSQNQDPSFRDIRGHPNWQNQFEMCIAANKNLKDNFNKTDKDSI